jgi:hypothetical protein
MQLFDCKYMCSYPTAQPGLENIFLATDKCFKKQENEAEKLKQVLTVRSREQVKQAWLRSRLGRLGQSDDLFR